MARMSSQDLYKAARALGLKLHPDAEEIRHMAFGNAMMYGVYGMSAVFGDLTPRTARARQILNEASLSSDLRERRTQVVALIEETCYGPMTRDIAMMVHSCVPFARTKAVLAEVNEARLYLESL